MKQKALRSSSVWRQFLLSAGLILTTFFLLGTTFLGFLYSYRTDQIRSSLENYARAVASLSSAYSAGGELQTNWNYQMSLAFAAEAAGNDAVICDPSGCVVVCSCESVYCRHLGKTVDAELLDSIDDTGAVFWSGRLSGIYDDERYFSGLPLYAADADRNLGTVIVSASRQDTQDASHQLRLILFYTFLPCLLIGLAASMVVAGHQTEPLRQLADAAGAMAMGDFTVRIADSAHHSREIREVTEAFNRMAEALQQTESRRQDFVAGVSHELKTPMTTIAGFVDGILDGTIPPEKHQQYLRTVSDEVHRLSRLVRSMLEVSRLQEAQGQEPVRDRFDIIELVSRVLLTYEKRINDRQLDVDVQFPELSVFVLANADSITRVVSNLLDNAVKFSDPNTTLGLGVYTVQGKAYVYVRNTGPTIPEEELTRIFERFHKTDRSRSEDRDGVGLGLYLVQSILNAHGEQITVTSRNGVTEFTFTLTLTV